MGLRAWPAKNVLYDGAWQLRVTAGHPSKRLNSLAVLDRSDIADMEIRLEKAKRHYAAFGRPLLIRETPLTPPEIGEYLSAEGAEAFDESLVMTLDLDGFQAADAIELLPSQDIGRFVDASLAINPVEGLTKAGLAEVVTAIKPAHGLFIREDDKPYAVGLAVNDFDMAGIEAFAVAEDARGKGHGHKLAAAMLRWAKARGARMAWLQVTATNAAAIALYQKLGFAEAYRYRYWREKQ